MRTLFSTERIGARDKFRTWREVTREHFVPTEQRKLGEGSFDATLKAMPLGNLLITQLDFGAQVAEATPLTIRRHDKHDTLAVALRLSGESRIRQYDAATIQGAGDLVVLDSAEPMLIECPDPNSTLMVELPRANLERVLGAARLYAALTVGRELPGAILAHRFFGELVRVHDRLSPEMAGRMAGVGIELLVAGIAERMARETPRPLHGTVVLQRAKAYVVDNLGDPTLDPPKLAAAVGVSLRRLQELFHERGQHISDHIWTRRLEAAAQRLADPGHAHVPIGTLSYGCGFVSQAHFSKRFRDRHGVSPREYRHAALVDAAREPSAPRSRAASGPAYAAHAGSS